MINRIYRATHLSRPVALDQHKGELQISLTVYNLILSAFDYYRQQLGVIIVA